MAQDPLLAFKPDAAEAKARLCDWWGGRRVDRAVASVTAPRAGVTRRPRIATLPHKYTDFETLAQNYEAGAEATFHGGEAFPCHWLYHGPVPMSAYFGGDPEFRDDTVWYAAKHQDDWAAARAWRFDPQNRWWQMALDLTRRTLVRARGRYLVSGCGLGGCADVIANLWGVEALLMQAAAEPETVRDLLRRMAEAFRPMYDELYALAQPCQDGYFDWLRTWAPGRVCTFQNDVSCMVSAGMFRDVFLDEIRRETEHVDFAIYHLDGPGAIQHLDALLSLPRLHAIQWVPGAGASSDPLDWLDLIRRIQAGGKKAWITCPPERVKDLLVKIDRQSVYLNIGCRTEADARACLAELERIGG